MFYWNPDIYYAEGYNDGLSDGYFDSHGTEEGEGW